MSCATATACCHQRSVIGRAEVMRGDSVQLSHQVGQAGCWPMLDVGGASQHAWCGSWEGSSRLPKPQRCYRTEVGNLPKKRRLACFLRVSEPSTGSQRRWGEHTVVRCMDPVEAPACAAFDPSRAFLQGTAQTLVRTEEGATDTVSDSP